MDWREKMARGDGSVSEMGVENMAASRLMRGMGATFKDIGKLCRYFGVEYREEETPFCRAVQIFRSMYADARCLDFIEAKSGISEKEAKELLLDDSRTGIMFFRDGKKPITAYFKGPGLMFSPIGQLIIKPGARYVANKDGVELWEQDPVVLVKSFSRR